MIHGLLKVILYAQDMETQVRFYRDVLGLTVKAPQGVSDFRNEYWVELETGGCTVVLHGGGQRRIGQDSPKLAFAVSDLQTTRDALLKRGAKLGEVRSPAPGVLVCDGFDPEGNPFSLDSHQ